ncbi:Rne/Rng family ribonuclease [bacterium]|nr:Rne/Rng family ribonuclease [bacterium]
MKKEIITNSSLSEIRIALLEDGTLVELYSEQPENERMVGDIYYGKVENVVEGIGAAFIDIGLGQNGFLPFAEIGKAYDVFSEKAKIFTTNKYDKKRNKNKEGIILRSGQEILVQVIKEPIGEKGTRLTSLVSLPGRFLVLVPHDHNVGVSRKIGNIRERNRLRRLARSIRPEGFGLIVRTMAVGKDIQTLRSDLDGLLKVWKQIEERVKKYPAPKLIHKDMEMASSIIRDLFSPDIDHLMVDNRKLHRKIKGYLRDVSPSLLSRLELYKEKIPIFDKYKIEDEIQKSLSRKIWLKGGGYIIFDQTEAMMVVDVNSGRSIGEKDHELHALKTDLEAACAIAHQLRLRDIGGIIVIDFIDLTTDKNRKKVVSTLKKELKKDRAAFDILPMSDFGLVEMTRERVRPSLLYRYSEPCPSCSGLGRIPAKNTIITKIERKIQLMKSRSGKRRFVLRVHPDMAAYLSDGIKSRIHRLMLKHFVKIEMISDRNMQNQDFSIE